MSHCPDLGSAFCQLCYLYWLLHSMWDLMWAIFSSSVWRQNSLIPKAGMLLLSPAGWKCPINTWNKGAPRESHHFIVCSLHWAGFWLIGNNGCQKEDRRMKWEGIWEITFDYGQERTAEGERWAVQEGRAERSLTQEGVGSLPVSVFHLATHWAVMVRVYGSF